ncbi:restriction endonuclease subunit S [Canibacter zhoujuaniae]|uniref:restriction endonuclease subunit S n=1 Tax=Canibacter zhoujuaniae TaxID=2708343 RepID=UPI001422513A|nr:restriction endonuclease subunit S [Canibacter zhoujuaniae]
MTAERMKPSGIEWIGDIPVHWKTTRVKYIAPAWHGLTYDPADISDTGTPVLRSGNIQNGLLELGDLIRVSSKVPEKAKAHTGDILICSSNGSRHLIGKNALVGDEGFAFGSFMMIARPKVNSRYFYYLLNSGVFDFYLPTYLTSTINQLTGANFGNMVLPIVDNSREQEQIVAVLDKETGKIDRAVELLRQQIETLEQLKKSVIHEAVTKGLDPTVPMKPSGVPWIGEIPESWKLVRQSSVVTKIGSGKTPLGGADSYVEHGIPLIRSQNIYGDKLHLDEVVFIDHQTDLEMWNTKVRPGDILLNITGVGTIGRSCVVPSDFVDGNVNQHVCIIRPIPEEVDSRYLQYCWSTIGQDWIVNNQTGATREAITFEKIGASKFPLPSINDQRQIADFLDMKCLRIGEVISIKQRQLAIFQQQKKSLIFEYVTGKRRVSEVA